MWKKFYTDDIPIPNLFIPIDLCEKFSTAASVNRKKEGTVSGAPICLGSLLVGGLASLYHFTFFLDAAFFAGVFFAVFTGTRPFVEALV